MTYNVANPRYLEDGRIDVEWEHPDLGWIPFTASASDVMDYSREIWEQVKDIAAPYAPVSTPTVYPPLTPRQLWLAALTAGVTKEQVVQQIDSITDQEEREWLRIELNEATMFDRSHPAIDTLSGMIGMPQEQLDTLWLWAATL